MDTMDIDGTDEMGRDRMPHPVTHGDAVHALQAAGFRAQFVNTGGGCMAYEVTLEGGWHVLVTGGVDVFDRVRVYGDGGWNACAYCSACGTDHDMWSETDHPTENTEDDSVSALVSLVRSVVMGIVRR